MRKLFILLGILVTVASTNAYAVSDEEIMNACIEDGKEKIQMKAEILGCDVNLNDVVATTVQNNFFESVKYVWYAGFLDCPTGVIESSIMVSYEDGKCR